jgi:4-alpha-glucanotransferase
MAAERDFTWWEVRRFANWAGFEVPRILPFEEVHLLLISALFRSRSWLAVCMITDLFGSTQRFNVPGAVSESNWSQRLAQPIAQWDSEPELAERMRRIREMLVATGRMGGGQLGGVH